MRKILIINLGGLGDILLSMPAIKALRQMHSEAEISLLMVQRVLKIAEKIDLVDKAYSLSPRAGCFFANAATLLKLRSEQFDLAINMRSLISKSGAFKLNLLLKIIAPNKTAGRNTQGRGGFFDINIPEEEKSNKHEMTYNKELVESLGAKLIDEQINWHIDPLSINKINDFLKEKGVTNENVLIGIHPGGRISRRWPKEYFLEVINRLSEKSAYKFVISGGPDEKELGEYFSKKALANVIDTAGRITLDESFALIKRCNLFISNDTGPMHFATILKTPLVAIIGPGDIGHYDPRAVSEKVIVLKKDIECAPCSKLTCDDMRCSKAITPDEVMQAVEKL